jgi:hypothetical protein
MNGNVLLGFLGGLAAGTLIGILVAPDEGAASMDNLSDKGVEYLRDIKEKYSRLIADMSDKLEDLRNAAGEAAGPVTSERFTV